MRPDYNNMLLALKTEAHILIFCYHWNEAELFAEKLEKAFSDSIRRKSSTKLVSNTLEQIISLRPFSTLENIQIILNEFRGLIFIHPNAVRHHNYIQDYRIEGTIKRHNDNQIKMLEIRGKTCPV